MNSSVGYSSRSKASKKVVCQAVADSTAAFDDSDVDCPPANADRINDCVERLRPLLLQQRLEKQRGVCVDYADAEVANDGMGAGGGVGRRGGPDQLR